MTEYRATAVGVTTDMEGAFDGHVGRSAASHCGWGYIGPDRQLPVSWIAELGIVP